MSKPAEASELVGAADAVEKHLSRLEALSASARKIRLHTEKSILRAARELQLAMEQQEQLSESLRSLAEVMGRTQQRQVEAIQPLAEHAVEIQARMAKFSEHMQRFGALGVQAGEATKLLQDMSARGEAETGDGAGETTGDPATLAEVDQRLGRLIDEAKSVATSAKAEDFTEIASDADTLKQQMQALRTRLTRLSPSSNLN